MLRRQNLALIICYAFFAAIFLHASDPLKAPSPALTVLFSPRDKLTSQLIPLLDSAAKSIHAAVYMLTDIKIADALIRAKNRGVTVQVIVDPISTGKYGKGGYLAASGVPLFIYQPPAAKPWFQPIMHNKFVCIDGTTLWTGSFNWTVSANLTNEENAIISREPTVYKTFKAYFDSLLTSKTLPYSAQQYKSLPAVSLADEVRRLLVHATHEEELLPQLLTVLQEYSARGSTVQPLE